MRCFVRAAASLADLRRLTADSKGAALIWGAKGLMHLAKTDRHEHALSMAIETIEKIVRERQKERGG